MVAIYSRQSLDKKDSISIETQIELCKKEMKDNSAYKVYQDKGFSGKNTDRPAFKELLKDIEENKINKLIVYRLDRISRSITDFASIIEFLEEHNVDFVSANEKFDTSAPMGRAMLYIIMIFAQLERETIAQRIKDSYYARGKKGIWLGGVAPLGFDIVNERIDGKKVSVLKENKDIKIVEYIFNAYSSSNSSLGNIARELKNEYGDIWSSMKVSRILHNPVYVKADADIYSYYSNKKVIIVNELEEFNAQNGLMLYGKRDRDNNKYKLEHEMVLSIAKHKGVVSSETFLKCQEKLSSNVQIKNKGKGKHSFLTGLIKCGYCGYGMQVKVYNDKKYLNCTGRYTTDLCIDKMSTHYLEQIEDIILKEIEVLFSKLNSTSVEVYETADDVELNEVKLELIRVNTEIENLVLKIPQANEVVIDYINKRITELDEEKINLDKKLEENQKIKVMKTLPKIDDLSKLDVGLKREIAECLISKIVLKNDNVDIFWNY